MILGLTGGIGCGKSTATRLFEEFGFFRVDSDDLIKTVVLPSAEVVAQIVERFGPQMVQDGVLDRAALARVVFTNEEELRWLEALLHPRLFEEWRRILDQRRGERLIFEVPLLFEKRLENWFDFTICVATTSRHQLARLELRGMSHALAEQRISKQLPLAQKIESADFVLLNDGSPSFLREQIATLVGLLARRS